MKKTNKSKKLKLKQKQKQSQHVIVNINNTKTKRSNNKQTNTEPIIISNNNYIPNTHVDRQNYPVFNQNPLLKQSSSIAQPNALLSSVTSPISTSVVHPVVVPTTVVHPTSKIDTSQSNTLLNSVVQPTSVTNTTQSNTLSNTTDTTQQSNAILSGITLNRKEQPKK